MRNKFAYKDHVFDLTIDFNHKHDDSDPPVFYHLLTAKSIKSGFNKKWYFRDNKVKYSVENILRQIREFVDELTSPAVSEETILKLRKLGFIDRGFKKDYQPFSIKDGLGKFKKSKERPKETLFELFHLGVRMVPKFHLEMIDAIDEVIHPKPKPISKNVNTVYSCSRCHRDILDIHLSPISAKMPNDWFCWDCFCTEDVGVTGIKYKDYPISFE